MVRKLDNKNMGRSDLGWLKSIFHFSFSSYYNPKNMSFGALRVINDDLIRSNTGFEMHPHRDMEIVSYVVDGELHHGDNMGNSNILTRGHVQFMTAGTGIYHSEHNYGETTSRFLQIWLLPEKKGLTPNYGDYKFKWEDRKNRWLQIVSGNTGNAPIKINQDANIHVVELDKGKEIAFTVAENRQAYLVQIEGSSTVNSIELHDRDALETVEEDISIVAMETSHLLVIEMAEN